AVRPPARRPAPAAVPTQARGFCTRSWIPWVELPARPGPAMRTTMSWPHRIRVSAAPGLCSGRYFHPVAAVALGQVQGIVGGGQQAFRSLEHVARADGEAGDADADRHRHAGMADTDGAGRLHRGAQALSELGGGA